jgi:hypothetical protein
MFMEDTYLPQRSKTKKEYIRELVQSDHNYSADEIARIAQTSKENVWKEKSRMASEGLIVSTRRMLKISAERHDETMLLMSSDTNSGRRNDILNLKKTAVQSKSLSSSTRIKSRSNNTDYSRYVDISPIDSQGMKKMYADFRDKKKPVDIIVEHGFPPAVVQIEYKRFLELRRIDIQKLQDYIGNDLLKYPLQAESLSKKYKQKGYLTTDEMIEVLKKKNEYYRRRHGY